jgi:23S rRNA (uridine2552-2'-O)-methyltransferase
MAANFSGIRIRDAESSLIIAESVFGFAAKTLRTAESRLGGTLLCVVWTPGYQSYADVEIYRLKHFTHPLLQQFRIENLEPNFHNVRYIKPDASRTASSEGYWLCQGWKGLGTSPTAG